jgi:hypothetical protein
MRYIIASVIIIVVPIAFWAARNGLRKSKKHWEKHDHKHGFWYEVVKDFAAPFLLAILGLVVGYQFNKQRDTEENNQRKAAILRDMMTTRNGPDVSFFTAVGERLRVHLKRFEKFEAARKEREPSQKEKDDALFNERAIYFFYGMFRVARMDFLATKGYVLYPRVWMEQAFDRMSEDVIKDFMCYDEDDLRIPPTEEAALYHYFGASRATYHTGTKRPDDPIPDLFDFNSQLTEAERLDSARQAIKDPHFAEVYKGFKDFQKRLHASDSYIHPEEIMRTFEAMIGLDDYAFNTLFSNWYDQFRSTPPTTNLPECAPDDFMPFMLDTFEPNSNEPGEWEMERQKAWKIILRNVPGDLAGNVRPCSR